MTRQRTHKRTSKKGKKFVAGKRRVPKVVYKIAQGVVLGNLWGGGRGYYPSDYEGKQFKSLSSVVQFLNKELKTGGLDSGMGFESLIGYYIFVEKNETFELNNKQYTNTE